MQQATLRQCNSIYIVHTYVYLSDSCCKYMFSIFVYSASVMSDIGFMVSLLMQVLHTVCRVGIDICTT